MKRKIIALLLCIVCVFSLCFPAAADDDGYSAIIGDIDKTCPTCGSALHAFWWSTSGAEVEVEISDTGKIKIPAGAGAIAHIDLKCKSCGYEKKETRLLGLDFGAEKPGKLVQAPSGIGRKDLPGYADYNKGTPSVDSDGFPSATYTMLLDGYDTSAGCDTVNIHNAKNTSNPGSWFNYTTGSYTSSNGSVNVYGIYGDSNNNKVSGAISYYLIAPVTGYYTITSNPATFTCSLRKNDGTYYKGYDNDSYVQSFSGFYTHVGIDTSWDKIVWVNNSSSSNPRTWNYGSSTLYAKKGEILFFSYTANFYNSVSASYPYKQLSIKTTAPTVTLQDVTPTQIQNNNTITINNNTWNGNIYTDNSTNLTYIYPQYTTINEKNETVTNISNTPIIYNNETKQYYTYDQTTKNYYYITYNTQPTPSPSPTPAPTEKPGGSISTPETGKPGNSSGSSWWDKLLDKIGNAVIDGLLGAVSAVLKLIFKLLSTILGWIIWAVSLVFTLFPFLPPGLSGLLVGGVVVCFVIGIIKFIRG